MFLNKKSSKILSIITLSLLFMLFQSSVVARGGKTSGVFHRVKQGEYLGKIAQKYGTNISKLVKWNRLKNIDSIPAGTLLKVGIKKSANNTKKSSQKPVYYKVRKGDTLSTIAKKYKTPVGTIQKWNKISNRSVLMAGRTLIVGYGSSKFKSRSNLPEGTRWVKPTRYTQVKTPLNYYPNKVHKKTYNTHFYSLSIYTSSFSQGHAAYLELEPKKPKNNLEIDSFSIEFLGNQIPLGKTSFGYRAIFAIPPEQKPGSYSLITKFNINNKQNRKSHLMRIADFKYPVSIWRRNVGKPGTRKPMKKETAEFIKKSSQIKSEAFKIRSDDKFSSFLSHPRSLHKITSRFFTTRKIVRYYYKNRKRVYLKPLYRAHRGTDLRGLHGAPIYAMASGKVVLSERMFYEGNFTMIDHGHGIFTGYMHQSKILVRNGDQIDAGQLIGKSGSTGIVTGPHLHMSLWIRGVAVEPLSLLSLPIRN